MDVNFHAKSQDFATALRVIGQDLADLLPLNLEIAVKEDQFVVTGRGLPEASQADRAEKRILRKVWQILIHHDPAADLVDWQLKSVPFTRTYSQSDISRWERSHAAKRTGGADLPDIYSLGERLRIIGRMVQAKGGDLIHLTKTLNSVAFEFRDPDGVAHTQEYSAEDLFRIQREDYSQRENGSESLTNSSSI